MQEALETAPLPLRVIVEGEQWRDRLAKTDPGLSVALRSVKPHMDFVKVRGDVSEEILPPNAVPGRWHVRDKSAKPLPAFFPIQGEGGHYREPDSGVLTELWRMDMRKRDVARRVFESSQRDIAKRKRAAALQSEQRKDEMTTDLRAGWRVSGSGGLNKRLWGKR